MEFIVDSSSRDKSLYPSPCKFRYLIPEIKSTISYIKLTGCAIPRSELNVSSHNSEIPFNVDDYITTAKVSSKGFGYQPGTYRSDHVNEYVKVSNPGIFSDGSSPQLNAVFENGLLNRVEIIDPGSLLFDGLFNRTVTVSDVGAEPGAVDATIRIEVSGGKITEILVLTQGDDWVFGVDNFGTRPYVPNLLFQTKGRKAVIEVTVGSDTSISGVSIVDAGQGYVLGNYNNTIVSGCRAIIDIPSAANFTATGGEITLSVGRMRVGKLREGQYAVDNSHDGLPGLCREVTRALQNASSPSLFPYTVLDSSDEPLTVGSCSSINSNPNAVLSRKIVIRRGETTSTNGNGGFLEVLFGTYDGGSSAAGLLGFGSASSEVSADSICTFTGERKMFREGIILPNPMTDVTYQDINTIGNTIFNLNDTPNYLSIKISGPPSMQKFISRNDNLNGTSFLVVFKTGTDNVYSNEIDSHMKRLDILGNDTIIMNPAHRMSHLDIEIIKPNGDLYGTTRELIMTFEIGTTSTKSNFETQ